MVEPVIPSSRRGVDRSSSSVQARVHGVGDVQAVVVLPR